MEPSKREALREIASSATWPYVFAFALAMERKLDANRDKGDREGWARETKGWLFGSLMDETKELHEQLKRPRSETYRAECVVREAADVANFAMMLADTQGEMVPDDSLPELLADAERLELQLDARRKIHAYIAFVLAGDEKADPQLAADALKARVDRYEAALKEIADGHYCGMREDVCDCGKHADDKARASLAPQGEADEP